MPRADRLPLPLAPPVPYVPRVPEEELALMGDGALLKRAVAAHQAIEETFVWRGVEAGLCLITIRDRLRKPNGEDRKSKKTLSHACDSFNAWLKDRWPKGRDAAFRYIALAERWQEDREGFLARIEDVKSLRGALAAIGYGGYAKKPKPAPAPAPAPRLLPAPKAKPPAKDQVIDAEFSVDDQEDSELDNGTDSPHGPADPDEEAEVPEPDERPRKVPSDPRARFAQRIYEKAEDLQTVIADASVLQLDHKPDGTFTDKDPKWTDWVNRIQGVFGVLVGEMWDLQEAYPADAPAGSEWEEHPFFREGGR